MTIDEIINILADIKGQVSYRTLSTIRKIYALSAEYSHLGNQFTFDTNAELDKEVNNLLIALSDAILDDIYSRVEEFTAEEDKDAVLAYIRRDNNGVNITERVDSHSSHLKYLLEGYLSVCFAEGLSGSGILGDALRYLANPYGYAPMKDAFNHSQDYKSGIIKAKGYHYGKGIATDPIKGFTNISRTGILDGFHYGTWLGFGKEGYKGYEVHRGSAYDCPACDEMCYSGNGGYRFYSINDIPPCPLHPNCCCFLVPVK